ncbi:MAG: hypothetical protein QOG60_675 [Frankiaceae bacterium]|nr:hypothetical protein [Frankiaceae bacterium]
MARLLQEIAELRLSATTNLTLAAAAMDAARPDIASDLIEAQQRDVADLRVRAGELLGLDGPLGEKTRRDVLHDAALEEYGLLERARVPATKSLRKQPSSGVVVLPARREQSLASSRWSASGALLAIAATIAVALVHPLAPSAPAAPGRMTVASLDANVDRSYGALEETARPRTPTFDVEQSARRLHADLNALLPEAAHDVVAARKLLDVLRNERGLLSAQAPDALDAFQAEAVAIMTRLRAIAQPQILAVLPQPSAVIGAVPAQIGDAVAGSARLDPPHAPAVAATGSGAGPDGSTAGSGSSDKAPSSAPEPKPASAPDPPAEAPTPTDTNGGSGGGSGGGTSSSDGGTGTGTGTVPPDPLPSVDSGHVLPDAPLPVNPLAN